MVRLRQGKRCDMLKNVDIENRYTKAKENYTLSNYKFLIRLYLLGFIQESTSRAEKYIERFGGDGTQVKKSEQTIDKMDEIFKPLNEQVREIMRLRFVDELEIKYVAERTGLIYNKVQRLCAGPIREVKELAKEYYKK